MEQHLRFPPRRVKEKAKNASRGHQRARVRRDQNAHTNTIPQKKGEAKGRDQEVLPPEKNSAERQHANRTGRSPSGKDDGIRLRIDDSYQRQDVHRRQLNLHSHHGNFLFIFKKKTVRKLEHILDIQTANGSTVSTLLRQKSISKSLSFISGFIWSKIILQRYCLDCFATNSGIPTRGRQERLPDDQKRINSLSVASKTSSLWLLSRNTEWFHPQ